MKIKKRSIGTCILLSIVTFGIYGIYWCVKIAKESVSVNDKHDTGTLEAVLALFFPCIGYYLAEKKFYQGCVTRGYQKEDRTVIYIIAGLFFSILNPILMQNDLNHYADACAEGRVSTTPVHQQNSNSAPMNANATNNTANITGDIITELKKYKALFDKGILTEEEFKAKKEQLLKMI